MELIKQIKDAEKQAKEIIEKAGQDAASILEEAKKQRDDRLKKSQQCRHKAIDDAVSQAGQEGTSQADQILQAGAEQIDALKTSSSAKAQACITKVLSALQQSA